MTDGPELDARPVDVQELLGQPGVQYVTPDFQRPFEWGEDQFEELWTDIMTAVEHDSHHFLGQVILVDSSSGDKDKMQIIDGQQRLTTISIFVCALRDYYEGKTDKDVSGQLTTLLSATAVADAEKQRRLKLLNHEDDDRQYSLVYNRKPGDAEGNVEEAYDYFSKQLDNLHSDKVDDVRKKLLKDLKLIRTETGDINSAYQVFQTENDRGMDLSPIDLIKSVLFEAAAKNPESDSDYVKNTWLDLVSKLDEVDETGARRPISHILGVSDFQCQVQMYPKRLVRNFQDIVRTQLDQRKFSVEDFVDFLKSESEIYWRANSPAAIGVGGVMPGEVVRKTRQFRYKNPHGGIVAYHIQKKYDDEQHILKALDLATILNVRLNLSDKTASNKRDPIYKIVKKDKSGDDLLEAIKRIIRRDTPTDNALYEHIANREFKQNKITKLVLLKLEQEHFNSNHRAMTIRDFQLEHIAPRKAFTKDQYTSWRGKFGHDEDKFREYREQLGNLTLLASKQNARAGSNPFDAKIPEYRSSEFTLTQRVCQYDDWTYSTIKQRSQDLAELVADTWSIE